VSLSEAKEDLLQTTDSLCAALSIAHETSSQAGSSQMLPILLDALGHLMNARGALDCVERDGGAS